MREVDGLVLLGVAVGGYCWLVLVAECCVRFCGADGVCW